MRVVLIDNHDSYTHNLAAQLTVAGAQVRVLANDDDALLDLHPDDLDGLVISPGPGTPLVAADVGHCVAVLSRLPSTPVLGVCLGHQLLAHLGGGEIVGVRPRHGHLSTVTHAGSGILAGIASPFVATRYHSLAVLPGPEFEVTARAEDGTVMALAFGDRPWWGVQFHPESVATGEGARVVDGWLAEVRARHRPWVVSRSLGGAFDPAVVFSSLYGVDPVAFWLSSGPDRCYLGGSPAEVVSYTVGAGLTVETEGSVRHEDATIWDFLARVGGSGSEPLPGGYVGYLGYGCKADAPGGRRSPVAGDLPDAQWLRADRIIVIDAGELTLRAVAGPGASAWLSSTADRLAPLCGSRSPDLPVVDPGVSATGRPGEAEGSRGRTKEEYLGDIARCREHLARGESYEICLTDRITLPPVEDPLRLYLALREQSPTSRSAYLRLGDLAICSTTPEQFVAVTPEGMVRARPIKGTAPRAVDPVEDAAHAHALASEAKTRAENLMIVDLLRHDLNRVCEPGSVQVPGFLEVESYATLHQLVSTIVGRLRADVGPIDAIRSCFPPGSMTGAPKERTMAIIDELEPTPRGIYAGALGYVGADGSVDLSVVIRTAVCTPAGVTIGVGGAITYESDPEEEYAETQLKALALLRGYAAATERPPPPTTGAATTPAC